MDVSIWLEAKKVIEQNKKYWCLETIYSNIKEFVWLIFHTW